MNCNNEIKTVNNKRRNNVDNPIKDTQYTIHTVSL